MSGIVDLILECRQKCYDAKGAIWFVPHDQRPENIHTVDVLLSDYGNTMSSLHSCRDDDEIRIGEKFKDEIKDLRDIAEDVREKCEKMRSDNDNKPKVDMPKVNTPKCNCCKCSCMQKCKSKLSCCKCRCNCMKNAKKIGSMLNPFSGPFQKVIDWKDKNEEIETAIRNR
mmetsp:Transcript_6242/g.7047  ORF Transcript_6242/g.7047 Transcript_6242/m.7047 type:complete len:170 (-) Transcript_6242:258-767(-)